jgi:nitrite reductase (cytochrome c-552)
MTAPENKPDTCTTGSCRGWVLFVVAAVATFALGLLVASILERRTEAQVAVQPRTIGSPIEDAASWKDAYPRQYDSYKAMADSTTMTKYGGSFPRDLLAEDPNNVILFSGYAFAVDYKQARGHVYCIEDPTETKRTQVVKQPATCWTCKSPDVPRLMKELGGPDKFYAYQAPGSTAGGFKDLANQVTHATGCADCHDAKTNALVITRPALVEGFKAMGKDITKATHQEMRTLVCAQCHVEYHFQKEPKAYLKFPWDKGLAPEDMEKYYDDVKFTDWTHAISKSPMIKMQHPDYELYTKSVHYYNGVSCADCHMPYKTEGGAKFSDHQVRSPLLNIANSCAVCHRWGEDQLRKRVEEIQDKVLEGRKMAESAIARAHFDVAACMQAGCSDDELKAARTLVRRAQLRWDYVAANNGMGFHAPQECQRILGAANDFAQEVRVATARLLAAKGILTPVKYPDFSTKEKAQALNKIFREGKDRPDLLGNSKPWPAAAPAPAPAAPEATPAPAK